MAWRKLWQYEASNPQRLSVAFLQARIEFTFNQALLPLRYVPQTWHEAASAMQALGHVDKARDYWTRGGEVLPDCDALHLALARFEEAQARPAEARQVLEALVVRRPTPLNFILLMRFSFRAEGLKEARKVFTRGRKAESCTWHVYAAAADMEHQLGSGNEGALVAQRIYALGADKFPTEVPFLLKYLQFLLARPDLTNVRAVLERALQAVQGRPALELWNFYLEVENRYGELEAAQKVEARRAAAFPELPTGSLYSLVAQHAQLGLWPAEPLALEWMREAHMAQGGAAAAAASQQAAAARPAQPHGAAVAPKRAQALAPPNLSLYVEYTGLDGDSAASAPPPGPAPAALAPAAGGPMAAPALPTLSQPLLPAFAGFIAALPPAAAYTGPAPAPVDVEVPLGRLRTPSASDSASDSVSDSDSDSAPLTPTPTQPPTTPTINLPSPPPSPPTLIRSFSNGWRSCQTPSSCSPPCRPCTTTSSRLAAAAAAAAAARTVASGSAAAPRALCQWAARGWRITDQAATYTLIGTRSRRVRDSVRGREFVTCQESAAARARVIDTQNSQFAI